MLQQLKDADPEYYKHSEGYLKALPTISAERSEKMVMETIRVPVVVHIIHNGEPIGSGQNLSYEQIEAQMDILNADFSATNAGYATAPARWADEIDNPNIQFCLASVDPDGTPTDGITRTDIQVTNVGGEDNIESEIKPMLNWDPFLYYNVYVLPIPGTTAGGGTTGYAYLPFPGTVGNGGTDGSVVDYRWFGGPGFPNSGSGTLTHETGHYLGLYHPFNGESCSDDDGIADTPNVNAPTSDLGSPNCSNGWPTGPMSCGNEHMYINYMDYAPDNCQISFTKGQVAVMRAVLDGTSSDWASRKQLADNVLAVCSFFDHEVALKEIISPIDKTCYTDDIIPTVEFTNLGLQTVTNLTITYQISANPPVVFNWIDNLVSGASTTINLPAFTPPNVDYTFTAWTSAPNGMQDEFVENDTMFIEIDRVVPEPLPFFETFESPTWNPTPNGLTSVDFNPVSTTWELNTTVGAFGTSNQSAWFDNFNTTSTGTLDGLITPILAVTDINNLTVRFDYAYTYYDNDFKDSLAVLASTDCGDNYDIVLFSKGGADLATKSPQTFIFTPIAEHWQTEVLDLTALGNPENVSLAFVNVGGYGNSTFIDNIIVTEGCLLNASFDIGNVDCAETCEGTVDITVGNAPGTLTYTYDNGIGEAGNSLTGLCPGNYSVTIGDGAGCSNVFPFVINSPDSLLVETTITPVSSPTANDGGIALSISGGTFGYSINWPPGIPDGPSAHVNLPPGLYEITITDGAGCIKVVMAEIPPFDCTALVVDFSGTPVDCNGESTGAITVVASGGAEPYNIEWNPASVIGLNPTALPAGLYEFTLTDNIGCSDTGEYEITQPTEIEITFSSTNVTTPGANDGTATASAAGGSPDYTYDWGAAGTGPSVSNLAPGFYEVTVTDSEQCTSTNTVEILDVDCTAFSAELSFVNPDCFDSNNGTVEVTAFGNGTIDYAWSISTDNVNMLSGLGDGFVEVTVSDENNCSVVLSATIVAPAPLELDLIIDQPVSCFGASDASLSADISGGTPEYTYEWLNGNTSNINVGLPAGYYCLTITDANGCTIAADTTLTEPDEIVAVETIMHLTAPAANDGSISLATSGGTGNLNFNWDNTMSGPTITNLAPGMYVVSITDQNNCLQIYEYQVLDFDVDCSNVTGSLVVADLSCANENDGTATATGMGGQLPYTYNWSNEGIGPDVFGLLPGVIIVTIQDAFGCEVILSDEILEPAIFGGSATSTATSGPGMSDGTVTALGTGGTPPYSYSWDIPATGEMVGSLAAGTYEVTILDANNCDFITSVVVPEGDPDCSSLTASISTTNVTCIDYTDGTAIAEVIGGQAPYEFLWSSGIPSGNGVSGLAAGIVSVTIVDNAGCEIFANGNVGQPDPIEINISQTPTSGPGQTDGSVTAIASGGTPGYMYSWDIPATGPTVNNLAAGTYEVTVTDFNGCMATNTITVFEGIPDCSSLMVEIEVQDLSCFESEDGSALAIVTGGTAPFDFAWSGGTAIGNQTFGLSAGVISIIVTDALDCEFAVSAQVNQPDPISVLTSATPTSGPGQNDGSVMASATGGTGGYTFEWSIPAIGATVNSVATGIYSVTATDANGCTGLGEVFVPEGTVDCSGVSASINVEGISCFGANDGSATATVIGATEPLQYNWSNDTNAPTASSLAPGFVGLTIIDALGCETIASAIVEEPSMILVSTSTTPTSGPGQADGSVTASASGGTAGYMYSWSIPATGPMVNAVPAGSYGLTVTDAEGCMIISEVVVGEGTADCTNFSANLLTGLSSCVQLGNAVVTVTGGTPQYQYNWSAPGTGNSAAVTDLNPGPIAVTVTDALGCEIMLTGTIDAVSVISLDNATVTPTSGPGINDGSIMLTASGGQGILNYSWSNSMSGPSISGLAPGVYTVTITDIGDCEIIESFEVEEGEACFLQLNTSSTMPSCFGETNGSATIEVLTGDGNNTIQWSSSLGSNETVSAGAGTYTVIVIDGEGCAGEETVTITNPPLLEVSAVGIDGSCGNLAAAVATVNGGTGAISYNWNTSAMVPAISDLMPGNYTVTVTDDNGCTDEAAVDVVIDNSTFDADYSSTNVSCADAADGSIDVEILQGTPPYTVNWSNGSSELDQDGLTAGTYSVLITDASGCNFFAQVAIQSPNPLSLSLFVQAPSVGANDGSIQAAVAGGTPPYNVSWNAGADGMILEDVGLGDYTATVTDANGCQYSETISIDLTSTQELSGLQLLEIYPNPTADWINVQYELATPQLLEVKLFTLLGQELFRAENASNSFSQQLDMQAMPQGVYWLVLENEVGERAWRKVVKVAE